MTDRRRLARVPWRRLTTREVYENRCIRVREDQVALPDGQTTIYGVVECAGCVDVLPFLDADTVVMVGQCRYVAGAFYWEMPTGAAKPGEAAEAAVQRELAEETGYEADRLVKLCAYHTSKSVVDETANIYLAEEAATHPAPIRSDGVHRGARLLVRRSVEDGGARRDQGLEEDHRGPPRGTPAGTLGR